MISGNSTNSTPTKVYQSDRFISARSPEGIANAYQLHSLFHQPEKHNSDLNSPAKTPGSKKARDEQSHRDETVRQIYSGIIRNELFPSASGYGISNPAAPGESVVGLAELISGDASAPLSLGKSPAKRRLLFQAPASVPRHNRPNNLHVDSNLINNVENETTYPSSIGSSFSIRPPVINWDRQSPLKQSYSLSPISMASQSILASPKKKLRNISKVPFKVLDAPELQDDFYLNLVDWSSLNVLAVGLASCVYLWNASTCKVTKLCDQSPYDSVTSVSWMQRGTHLAVGTSQGTIQIWDIQQGTRVRNLVSHRSRVGALAWNDHILSSGSRDKSIIHHDVRSSTPIIRKLVQQGHKQEVCGLKWSPDYQQLASGGNDNRLLVWDKMNDIPTCKLNDHTAAVKAIAWSPHQHSLLASGGGTADRHIRFWNTISGSPLNAIDTGSQVCNLAWSKNSNELVSTHGYSQNQVLVWRYPSMTPLATLTGHTSRVLYLAMSPDGQTIVTGAGDETLRFWNVFCGKGSSTTAGMAAVAGLTGVPGIVGASGLAAAGKPASQRSLLDAFAKIR